MKMQLNIFPLFFINLFFFTYVKINILLNIKPTHLTIVIYKCQKNSNNNRFNR